ncbi:MAG TPA: peptide chain release factor-like protein, partial [Kofleriaceae bacterium]|nr:peptide chain release factor-like protein [Kofleriaceae bacterium]
MTQREALLLATDNALLAQCEVDRYRASGPGGQHRNKTESAVRIRHLPTGVSAIAEESRSQAE